MVLKPAQTHARALPAKDVSTRILLRAILDEQRQTNVLLRSIKRTNEAIAGVLNILVHDASALLSAAQHHWDAHTKDDTLALGQAACALSALLTAAARSLWPADAWHIRRPKRMTWQRAWERRELSALMRDVAQWGPWARTAPKPGWAHSLLSTGCQYLGLALLLADLAGHCSRLARPAAGGHIGHSGMRILSLAFMASVTLQLPGLWLTHGSLWTWAVLRCLWVFMLTQAPPLHGQRHAAATPSKARAQGWSHSTSYVGLTVIVPVLNGCLPYIIYTVHWLWIGAVVVSLWLSNNGHARARKSLQG